MEGPGCVQEPGLVVLICLKSEVRRLIGSFTHFSGKVKSLWCPGSRPPQAFFHPLTSPGSVGHFVRWHLTGILT